MKNKVFGWYERKPLESACWSYVLLTIFPGILFPTDNFLAESLVRYLLPGAAACLLAVRFYGAGMDALSLKGMGKALLLCSPVALLCGANLIFGEGWAMPSAGKLLWILCGAFSEELLGRLFLFGGVRTGAAQQGWSSRMTIILAGAIFGAMHAINFASQGVIGTLLQCVYTAAVGALFAWSYHKTGNLWGAILWHMALNLTALG